MGGILEFESFFLGRIRGILPSKDQKKVREKMFGEKKREKDEQTGRRSKYVYYIPEWKLRRPIYSKLGYPMADHVGQKKPVGPPILMNFWHAAVRREFLSAWRARH